MNRLILLIILTMTIGIDPAQGQLDRRSGTPDFAERAVKISPIPPQSGYEPPKAAEARSLAESTAGASPELLTHAEQTQFEETGDYAEVNEFVNRLQRATPFLKVQSFGKTAQNRDMLLIVVSKDRAFSPSAARKSAKPVILIQNCIHAGEVGGKDATLMLLREILITKRYAAWLDHLTLLVIPVFNVDGHERRSPFNRINQNGPREMGFRATAQRLNLNRDFAKADTPEMQSWLRMYREWLPELMIDNHTTDGADYQYDITVHIPVDQDIWPTLSHWAKGFLRQLGSALEDDGHIVSFYVGLGQDDESEKGLVKVLYPPRFGSGYAAVQNRVCLLVETHSLKKYKTQVWAHYDLMRRTLEEVVDNSRSLRKAVSEADDAVARLAREYHPNEKIYLWGRVTDESTPYIFKAVESRYEASEISGERYRIYSTRPVDRQSRLFDQVETTVSASVPLAYAIPPEWKKITDLLQLHGIDVERLEHERRVWAEVYHFRNAHWSPEPFEGHHRMDFKIESAREKRVIPAGWFLIPMTQRAARLALNLLEPEAPDSMVRWGMFDTIFEQKEGYSDYLMERLAREMLKRDPSLKKEFEEKLASDQEFRESRDARLNFFYVRSPYFEPDKNVYPVLRIVGD